MGQSIPMLISLLFLFWFSFCFGVMEWEQEFRAQYVPNVPVNRSGKRAARQSAQQPQPPRVSRTDGVPAGQEPCSVVRLPLLPVSGPSVQAHVRQWRQFADGSNHFHVARRQSRHLGSRRTFRRGIQSVPFALLASLLDLMITSR